MTEFEPLKVVLATDERRRRGRERDRRDLRPSELECRVLLQDSALELADRRSRFESVRVPQHPSRIAERLEGINLPVGPVQREHERGPEPLAFRVLPGQRAQLVGQVEMKAELESCIDAVVEDGEALLLEVEPCFEQRARGEARERRRAPQVERIPEGHPRGRPVLRRHLVTAP